ncbi:Histone-lysine N-methyltransferase, H3 lysine-36 specific [Lecanosticta acicola]|uniref:Histone-lysine N-methyltransferase, H3 lysine-36 specific n=1 Tax=Lecanosticta acicola TaxID=111012 RepID=A0AAI8YS57_9PEZI|nr:Histone-lysine N-methyltransferase, H3 lysine-36 specific [Lecanosticta acicola]
MPEGKHEPPETEVRDMQLKEEDTDLDMDNIAPVGAARREASTPGTGMVSASGTPRAAKRQSRSPVKRQTDADSPAVKSDQEEIIGGDVTLELEPGKPPKLARSTSHKVEKRPPQLFFDHEDKTTEASASFDVLPECTYANKFLGTTESALECDCAEEWDPATLQNHACGEESDCINRATKMECIGDCGCGVACQNQRFQRKQYADVTVIRTEKKGYGLRANTDLRPNDFIFEYIGEVIGENVFRRRMQQYDEEGIKHFYFMSLTKGEFVDATKRGNLGRFCNHSCNPNCYVDKWVIGDKLRMGIFAERRIRAGEELVFNYNVDRYGAEPQPCYCGEPNCTGYIGGKTQTDRGTKLSHTVIEALGIDDADAWDTAVAKRPRKKKLGEDDEEYVNNVEPRGLDEEGVNKVMSSLMQCKEKWIAVKLLTRIQRADDEKVRNRVVRFHGYRILKTALSNFSDDVNVCLQVLDILDKMPRLTRNKIQDSKIEEAVAPLTTHEDDRVSSQAQALIDAWSKLEVAYRIPRVKRDPNAVVPDRKADRFDRRDGDRRRSRSRSRSKSPEKVQAPSGPRSNAPQRAPGFRSGPRFRPPPPGGALPPGWFEATAANGSTYYYNQQGTTTWQRPPASAAPVPPPPPPPKAVSDQQMLNDLIKNIVASKKEPAKQPPAAATPVEAPKTERKEDKWRSLPIEKQKKLYEGTLQPHIMHVVGKYKSKLAKDDLKRWAREFAKQVVESDFKKNRVENPNKINDKKAKEVKKHAQTFFEKAVKKLDKKKSEKKSTQDEGSTTPLGSPPAVDDNAAPALSDHDMDAEDEDEDATPGGSANSPSTLKRKHAHAELANLTAEELIAKKQRLEAEEAAPPPPPPPPPPPAGDETDGADNDLGFAIKGAASQSRPVSQNGEPRQIATPPTTGSPDHDEAEKAVKRANFAGMNPDRMRQLGLMDGASG